MKVIYTIEPISAIDLLPDERMRKVIKMRLGLPPYERQYTLKEIGEHIENRIHIGKTVTKERVRGIERKALRMLTHPSRNAKVTIL